MGTHRYEYLACDGGPHIVLPLALAASWAGLRLEASDVLDPSTDFGRACAVQGDAALIAVGAGYALALGNNPPMTASHALSDGSGIDLVVLQEWHTDDLDSLVDTARIAATSIESFRWVVPDGGAALMFAGDEIDKSVAGVLPVPIRGGLHAVSVASIDLELGAACVCRIRRV